MKHELLADYGVSEQAITLIPFWINNAIPNTKVTSAEAKQRLGIRNNEKTILFFGNIRPSKGLQYLLAAFKTKHAKSFGLSADHSWAAGEGV